MTRYQSLHGKDGMMSKNCPKCGATSDNFGHYPKGREYNIGCWVCGHKWFVNNTKSMSVTEQHDMERARWEIILKRETKYRGFKVHTWWAGIFAERDGITIRDKIKDWDSVNPDTVLHIIFLVTKE